MDEWKELPHGSAERRQSLLADLGAVATEFETLSRRRLVVSIRGGEILMALKVEIGHGAWTKALERFARKSRTLQKWMRVARFQNVLPKNAVDGGFIHEGLEEAIDWIADYEEEEKARRQGTTTRPAAPAEVEPVTTTTEQPAEVEPVFGEDFDLLADFVPDLIEEAVETIEGAMKAPATVTMDHEILLRLMADRLNEFLKARE